MSKVIMGAIDAALLGVALLGAAQTAHAEPRAVVELFTSQGCSSCPAADKLLSELKSDPSLITLSLPIDYWDYLGWKDTLASPGHTARQKAYSRMRGDREVYTPQVVVNGVAQVLGSNREDIEKAVAEIRSKSQALSVPVISCSAKTASPCTSPPNRMTRSRPVKSGCVPSAERCRSASAAARTTAAPSPTPMWCGAGSSSASWSGKSESFSVPVETVKSAGADAVAVIVQGGTADKPGAMLGASIAALR